MEEYQRREISIINRKNSDSDKEYAVFRAIEKAGYSAAKVATIPTQSTPPIPLQR